jgi:glycosyltransferase involved in cell wall biosynthesis
MPNAILEAMSYSKPIVASDIDGVKELLLDSKCGFLFEKGNARDLADKMLQIMNMSDGQRRLLGSMGRDLIEEKFSERVVLENWQNVINTI